MIVMGLCFDRAKIVAFKKLPKQLAFILEKNDLLRAKQRQKK
jgi:hypothetical protein